MAQLKDTIVDGDLNVNNNVYLNSGGSLSSKGIDGTETEMVGNIKTVYYFGRGCYNSGGTVNYLGDNIQITSNNSVSITSPTAGLTNRAYGENKVLWEGNYYMTDTHKITLSESVSAQPNGIVLVWSLYSNGAAENAGFNYIFVPKQHITSFAGCGVSCFLTGYANSTGTSAIGFKYVYVNNASIVGNANNSYVGASNALTLASNKFVLRQVIGV